MKLHKLSDIQLGGLEDLDFANVDIAEREDARHGLLNLLTDNLWDELAYQLLEVAGRGVANHDLDHLGADLADLTALGVGGLLDLCVAALGKADGKHTQQVAVGGLDIDVGLDDSLPLPDEGAELIPCKIHSIKVGQARAALNLLALESDLAIGLILRLLEIGEAHFVDAALERFRRDLGSLGTRDKGLADLADGEDGGGLDIVPLLAHEGVHLLLAGALALLGQTLVLADSLQGDGG